MRLPRKARRVISPVLREIEARGYALLDARGARELGRALRRAGVRDQFLIAYDHRLKRTAVLSFRSAEGLLPEDGKRRKRS